MSSIFKIVSVEREDIGIVKVRVRIDSKAWFKLRDAGQLGQLYGVDISNAAYRLHGVKAHNPSVLADGKARGGLKWVTLYYNDSEWVDVPPCEVIHVDFVLKCRIDDDAA